MQSYPSNHEIFWKSRILFTIEQCRFCRLWSFLEIVNAELPYNKRIEVINCTPYHDYGIVEDPRIEIFMPYIDGLYPSLFIDGQKAEGSNSEEELIAWITARLQDEFLTEPNLVRELDGEPYPLTFNKSCSYIKKGIFGGKRLICTEH